MIHFDIKKIEKEVSELEKETQNQEFWNNISNATIILAKMKSLKNKLSKYNQISQEIKNLKELSELVQLENDVDMAKEMTEYTKYTVLQQAGTSVLAQANDIPQSVLQLLQ